MSDAGLHDLLVPMLCSWYERHAKAVQFHTIDFSRNYLTVVGIRQIMRTLMKTKSKVKVLKLHHNLIDLDYGGVIEEYLRSCEGSLLELHLSSNKLSTGAISDILLAAISLKNSKGDACYPVSDKTPLWLRADNNPYDSHALEDQLRSALAKGNSKQPLEEILCNVTHALECRPDCCKNRNLAKVPQVQSMYLFPHWKRSALDGDHKESKATAQRVRCTLTVSSQALNNALHELKRQQIELRTTQSHKQAIAQASKSIPRPQDMASCKGFLHTKLSSLAIASWGHEAMLRELCIIEHTKKRNESLRIFISIIPMVLLL